jgi:Raf kinase inhibitor-like YbhB/YbcL family protein
MFRRHHRLIAAAATAFLAAVPLGAQQPDPLTDFQITGHVYEPQAIAPSDERIAALVKPAGFHVHRFAEGLYNPRIMATADDGTIYVTQRTPGNLVMLQDLNRDGVVDAQKVVLRLKDLHGITLRGRKIYLVTVKMVFVADLRRDGSLGPLETVTSGLPDGGQHPNRTLAFGPDAGLYVSVGSTCNACMETSRESATLLRVDLKSGKREIFASGLRNTIGFGWHPSSRRLFGMDQGIDWLGDEEQSEELNEILKGKRYGWPYIYDEGELNPQDEPLKVTQQQWAEKSENPVSGYEAHAAAMQLRFYEAGLFPVEYRNNAFVAFHGSWNRKPSSGYEVVRLRFDSAGGFEGFEPFVTGFLQPQPNQNPPLPGAQPLPPDGFIGRPVGITVAGDGSLLIGDDSNNIIYRVAYGNTAGVPSPQKLAQEIVKPKLPAPIQVRSSAFPAGGPIPEEFSDYGEGKSPPLSWSPVPNGTRSIVLMMEDPAATSPLPFVHWIAVLPERARALPEGIPPIEKTPRIPNAQQGSNSRSEIGYFGPRPPPGDAPHPYHFQVFALDKTLSLPSGFNRHALLEAIEGHVLAQGDLVGTFAKEP